MVIIKVIIIVISADIGVEIGSERCAVLVMKKGK